MLKRLIANHGLVLLLLAISVIVHFWYGVNHVSFGQDAGRDALIMLTYQRDNQWIVGYGPKASVGDFYLPPFYYQLHNIVSRATNNYELAMLWLIIFVESLTAVVLYKILRMFVRRMPAFLTSLLYIISPLALNFSTSMWNPNMIPFFSTLALWGWLIYLLGGKPRGIIIGIIGTVIAVHLHYQAAVLMLFPMIVFGWSAFQKQVKWRYWIIGIFIGLITFIPYITTEISRGWGNTREIVEYFTGEHVRTFERVSKPGYILSFLPAFSERLLIGGNAQFFWLGRLVFWGGMALLIYLAWKKRSKYLWLLAYLISVMFMLRVYKGDKLDYYMSVLYIMPFLLLGLGFEWLLEKYSEVKNNRLTRVSVIIILVSLVIFVSFRAGKHVRAVKVGNGLNDLNQAVIYIGSQTQSEPVKLYFHQKDYKNQFIYGFYKYGLVQRDNSVIWIDICEPKRPCQWNGRLACEHNEAYTKAALVKTDRGYRYVSKKTIGPYQLIIGKIEIL